MMKTVYDFDPDSVDPVLVKEYRKNADGAFPTGLLGACIATIGALGTIVPVVLATIWAVGAFGWWGLLLLLPLAPIVIVIWLAIWIRIQSL